MNKDIIDNEIKSLIPNGYKVIYDIWKLIMKE